jgi:CheY-like chemotaxis protein
MRFPLYHRPNSIVFLDDDANYLEMLGLVMPRNWCVRLYTHVGDCMDHIRQEHPQWEADVWSHHQMVDNWKAGTLLIPRILQYWQTNPYRYGLTKICVVDFSMPTMTGLDVLKALPVWPANRVLLTGKADESIAVSAFNDGLIDRFVPKQHPDIGTHLARVLQEQHTKPLDFHDGIWRSALKQEQYAALQENSAAISLFNLIEERGVVEYVVVPAPFGILGIDTHAQAHWLQMELTNDLPAAADLAQSSNQPSEVVQKIRLGTHFINVELLMALHTDEKASIASTFKIGQAGTLLGAFFPMNHLPKQGISHQEFMMALPPRSASQLS